MINAIIQSARQEKIQELIIIRKAEVQELVEVFFS